MSILNKNKYVLIVLLYFTATNLNAQSVGGTTSGAAAYCDSINSGFISLTGYTGSIYWQESQDAIVWQDLPNPTPTQSYLNLAQTTHYRAVVTDGVFPADTSTISTVTIYIASDAGTLSGGGLYCLGSGAGTLSLSGVVGTVLYWQSSIDGGVSWTQIPNTTTTLNYPSITENTLYNAVVENVSVCPVDTSNTVSFTVDTLSVAGTLLSSDTICYGLNNNVLTLSGSVGNVFDWMSSIDGGVTWVSEGITTSSITTQNLIETIQYKVIMESGVCPMDTTNTIELTVILPNPVTAGNDFSIALHESVTLEAIGDGSVLWRPSAGLDDASLMTPIATPAQTTAYVVTLTDQNSCTSTDTVIVNVSIPIPSAITPNDDNVNDFFFIDKLQTLPNNSLSIYNRQGNVVYSKSPYANEWNGVSTNGKKLPDGIYYYVFDYGEGAEPIMGYVLVKR